MTLSVSDTITAFQQPIPALQYPNMALLQNVLLNIAVTTGSPSLAATRLVSLLFDLDISSLFLESVTPPDFSAPDPGTLAATQSVNNIVNNMDAYANYISLGLGEAASFLPAPTFTILNNYNTTGSPVYRVGVAIFVILAYNVLSMS